MRDDLFFFNLEDQRHRELIEEAERYRLLNQTHARPKVSAFRMRLGDLLIELGYRVKASCEPVSSQLPAGEISR